MDSLTPVAEQGFQGESVNHKDKETMIGDWNNEFGPKSGHRSPRTICKDATGRQPGICLRICMETPIQKSGS